MKVLELLVDLIGIIFFSMVAVPIASLILVFKIAKHLADYTFTSWYGENP